MNQHKNVAIVGCGRISRRHIDAIAGNTSLEITALCDVNPQRLVETSQLFSDVSVSKPFQETAMIALNGRNIQVASICTPSGLHPDHAVSIAEETDIPHIIVEKPISLTIREAVELYQRVDRAGKRLLPVYQNRYNPLVQLTKTLIETGLLGDIYQFNVNVFWNRNQQYFDIDWHGTRDLDGGVLYTQASHYVDMLLYLFGPVRQAKGIGGKLRGLAVQDTVSAVIEHDNGAIGSLNCTVSTYRKNYLTEFTIIGSRGTVRLQGTNLNAIEFWDVENRDRPNLDFDIDHIYGNGHNLLYEYVGAEQWEMFPTRDEVLSGVELMERLSF